jgi:hypothetical protein
VRGLLVPEHAPVQADDRRSPIRPRTARIASPREAERSGERPARAARRVRGDKASSTEPAFRARGPSPADLRSAASPAARARRYGRCRGRNDRRSPLPLGDTTFFQLSGSWS